MSDETIVAIYDTPAHARLAAADLLEAGVPESAIDVHAGHIDPSHADNAPPRDRGFWSNLFGGSPDHDTAVYERSVGDGASVLSVKTPDRHVERVMDIIESHGPIDIDERAMSYVTDEAAAVPTPAPSAIENLDGPAVHQSAIGQSVDRRVINRGGTRIRRFVAE